MATLKSVTTYLGTKITYCSFWDKSFLVFWPKEYGSDAVSVHKFKTLEEAKAFIREKDDELHPENGLMRYLAN